MSKTRDTKCVGCGKDLVSLISVKDPECRECYIKKQGQENTQGLINKDLLLE